MEQLLLVNKCLFVQQIIVGVWSVGLEMFARLVTRLMVFFQSLDNLTALVKMVASLMEQIVSYAISLQMLATSAFHKSYASIVQTISHYCKEYVYASRNIINLMLIRVFHVKLDVFNVLALLNAQLVTSKILLNQLGESANVSKECFWKIRLAKFVEQCRVALIAQWMVALNAIQCLDFL